MLNDLGLVSWASSRAIRPLRVSERLLRNLAHLDKAGLFFFVKFFLIICALIFYLLLAFIIVVFTVLGATRGQYKIGVMYVSPHHDNKMSIITCEKGSDAFDRFVETLGWMVSIDTHLGYLGNLKRESFQGAPWLSCYKILHGLCSVPGKRSNSLHCGYSNL